jgi:hypothetical protein
VKKWWKNAGNYCLEKIRKPFGKYLIYAFFLLGVFWHVYFWDPPELSLFISAFFFLVCILIGIIRQEIPILGTKGIRSPWTMIVYIPSFLLILGFFCFMLYRLISVTFFMQWQDLTPFTDNGLGFQ